MIWPLCRASLPTIPSPSQTLTHNTRQPDSWVYPFTPNAIGSAEPETQRIKEMMKRDQSLQGIHLKYPRLESTGVHAYKGRPPQHKRKGHTAPENMASNVKVMVI